MTSTLSMPDRLIPLLSACCGLLLVAYLALVGTTIFYASWQSQTVSSVRDTESTIGNLESQYYSTISKVSAMDPRSLGFVNPSNVQYVAAATDNASNLSFAGK